MAAQLHAQRQPPWENLRTRATRMTPPASAPLPVSGAFPLLAGFHALAAWLQQSCVRLENQLGKAANGSLCESAGGPPAGAGGSTKGGLGARWWDMEGGTVLSLLPAGKRRVDFYKAPAGSQVPSAYVLVCYVWTYLHTSAMLLQGRPSTDAP